MSTRLDRNSPPRTQPPIYDFPDQVITGTQDTHIILCIPASLAQEQLAGLSLLYDTLQTNALQQSKHVYVSVHFIAQSSHSPVHVQRITDPKSAPVLSTLIQQNVQRAAFPTEKASTTAAKEVAHFQWKDLQTITQQAQNILTPADHRVVVFIAPEGHAAPQIPQDYDVVTVRFPKDGVSYPYAIDHSQSSPKAQQLTQGIDTLAPCAAHQQFVRIFGAHQQHFGKAPLARVYAAQHNKPAFLMQNALRALLAHKDLRTLPLRCDAEFAMQTSQELYIPAGDLASTRTPSNDPVISTFDYNYTMESLLLFHQQTDRIPQAHELIGLAASYYEFLVEQHRAGDAQARAFLLHHTLPLILQTASNHANASKRKLPQLAQTLPHYFERSEARPSDLAAALFRFAPRPRRIDTALSRLTPEDSGSELTYTPFYGQPAYGPHVLHVLAPLVERVRAMTADQQKEEIARVLQYAYGATPQLMKHRGGYSNTFLIVLDLMYTALHDSPAMQDRLTRGLVDAVTRFSPAGINAKNAQQHNISPIIRFLARKQLLQAHHAQPLLDWTHRFSELDKDTHRNLLFEIHTMWAWLLPLLSGERKEAAQRRIRTQALAIMTEHRHSYRSTLYAFVWGDHRLRNHDSLAKSVVTMLDLPHALDFVTALIDTDVLFEYFDDAVTPSLHHLFARVTRTGWLGCVTHFMQHSVAAWRAAPDLLLIPKQNIPGIFTAVAQRIQHMREFDTVRESDAHYTKLMIEAIAHNDANSVLHHYQWWSTRRSVHSKKVDALLRSPHLSDVLARNVLQRILQRLARDHDLHASRVLADAFLYDSPDKPAHIPAHFSDADHGALWEAAFTRLQSSALRPEAEVPPHARDAADKLCYLLLKLYPQLAPHRQLRVLAQVVALARRNPSPESGYYISQMVTNLSAAHLVHTEPVLAFLVEWETHAVEYPLSARVLTHWHEHLDTLPFAAQMTFFRYIVGPLAPVLQRMPKRFTTTIQILLRSSSSLSIAQKTRAIAKHLSASPYLSIMGRMFRYKFTADEFTHLLMGFAEAINDGAEQLSSNLDVERFLATACLQFEKQHPADYTDFMVRILREPQSDLMVRTVLAPLRNTTYEFIRQLPPEMAASQIAIAMMTLQELCLDPEIPRSTRRYVWHLLRQLDEDVDTFPALETIRPLVTRMRAVRALSPDFPEVLDAWEREYKHAQ